VQYKTSSVEENELSVIGEIGLIYPAAGRYIFRQKHCARASASRFAYRRAVYLPAPSGRNYLAERQTAVYAHIAHLRSFEQPLSPEKAGIVSNNENRKHTITAENILLKDIICRKAMKIDKKKKQA